jgi:IS30 family transposase
MKHELEKEWRRDEVLELSSQGYSEREIGSKLQVSHITVHRDLVFLKTQAQENLQKHIHQTIPHEFQKAMDSLNQVLRMCWSIVSKTGDEKTRLQALALINDYTKYRVDLSTNGVVITDAIKYVNSKMDHLNDQEKEIVQDIQLQQQQEQEQPKEEEETTTTTINSVF